MNSSRSLVAHLLEISIAGAIIAGLVFLGLYAFNFRITPPDDNIPKRTKKYFSQADKSGISKGNVDDYQPLITTAVPSQEELLRQLIGAQGSSAEEQPPRELEPWEKQIQAIDELVIPAEEKVRRLLDFARTLSQEEQAFVYSAACSLASSSTYQQRLYPLVWNPQTPGLVARAVAAGVVTEPDGFKFPALLALQRHPDEETRAMALSVLWAYFPDEPVANYPLAVQRFLGGSY